MHLVTAPPSVDASARRLLTGFALAAVGTGCTVPFLFVYLSRVRDLGPGTTGLLYAWMGLVGVVAAMVIGPLVDRHGPRPVLLGAAIAGASSLTVLARLPTDAGLVPLLAVLAGLVAGAAPLWPATTVHLARSAGGHPAVRDRLLALAFLALNAGIGVGSVLGSLVVDVARPASFAALLLTHAATYVVLGALVATLPRGPATLPRESAGGAPETAGWGVLLADRRLLLLCACGVLAVTFGYGQIEAGATAYAVEMAGVPTAALGWAFAANTVVVVAAQLPMLRLVAGVRRTTALAVAALTWSAAWVAVAASDPLGAAAGTGAAVVALVLGLALFGLGETLWAPIAGALADDLATDATRGRHHAALGLVWTLGQMLGPAVAGLLIGSGHGRLWAAVVIGGTLGTALLLSRFRRLLTPEEDGVAAPREAAIAASGTGSGIASI